MRFSKLVALGANITFLAWLQVAVMYSPWLSNKRSLILFCVKWRTSNATTHSAKLLSFKPNIFLLSGEQEPVISSDSDISLIMAVEVGLSDVDLSTDQDCEEVKS